MRRLLADASFPEGLDLEAKLDLQLRRTRAIVYLMQREGLAPREDGRFRATRRAS